jgi:hypothetical protein
MPRKIIVTLRESNGIDLYRRELRRAVYGLWSGKIDRNEFWSLMRSAVNFGLNLGWADGAKTVGIGPEDYPTNITTEKEQYIMNQLGYIDGFGAYIEENSKANGKLLGSLNPRLNMWANQYNHMKNWAMSADASNPRLKWIYGPTEHCPDCLNLNGRVYRAKTWRKWGVAPQSPGLACHGFHCQCRLDPTTDDITPGRPPNIGG